MRGIKSLHRRAMLVTFFIACMGAHNAIAQSTFPTKPVTIHVPFTAGGFSDTVARSVGAGLSTLWNAPVVVENRPGGGGFISAGVVIKSAADGYVLFLANVATNAINPNVFLNPPFDVQEELEPVILVARTPNLLAVGNEQSIKSVKEFAEISKTQQLTFGTPGIGSSGHLSAEMFASRVGVKFLHIPYKGSRQVLLDVVNGNLQFVIDNVLTWAPLANAGRVRPIAVTGLKRSPLLPDVPTLDESGYPGFEASSWFGIAAPKNTPREIIAKLNADINAVISTPDFLAKVTGAEVVGGTAESFKAYIAAERKQWGQVTRSINLTSD